MIAFVILHVSMALSSIVFSTVLIIAPVARRFKVAYGLVAATLVSGIGLVIVSHSNLLSACQSGITYLVIASVLLAVAQRRLGYQTER